MDLNSRLAISMVSDMERLGANAQLAEHQEPFEIMAQNEQGDVIPRVTVAISLYNYEQYIIECLESTKSQTISDLDLIIVDDCSTDGSPELVGKWLVENGNRFTKYLLIRHKVSEGLSNTRNSGFAYARTEYVFVLDADNLLYPRCLERLIAALDNCDASFAYCYLEKFGNAIGLKNTRAWDPATLQHGNTIDAMVLLRKSVWEKVGGYSTDEVIQLGFEDFDLWFRIARARGWGILVPEILARYRVHNGSMCRTVTSHNLDKLWAYLRSGYPEFF